MHFFLNIIMQYKLDKSVSKRTLVVSAPGNPTQNVVDDLLLVAIRHAIKYEFDTDNLWRVILVLPESKYTTTLERLSLLDLTKLGMSIECFVIKNDESAPEPIRIYSQYELLHLHSNELIWPEGNELNPFINHLKNRIINLAPNIIEVRKQTGSKSHSFYINGLEFAHINKNSPHSIGYGIAGLRNLSTSTDYKILSESNFDELKTLVDNLLKYRSGNSADRSHAYYRLRSEAWLESLIRKDVCIIDSSLNEEFVYTQIPAWHADKRSVIDLLTINQNGRLVIIEIKVVEDIQLPMQGLDYWLRIEQARLRGEFANRGMFKGITLADEPPLLYLVGPQLRFHRYFSKIASCFSPSIEAFKIGINLNWRNSIKIRSFRTLSTKFL